MCLDKAGTERISSVYCGSETSSYLFTRNPSLTSIFKPPVTSLQAWIENRESAQKISFPGFLLWVICIWTRMWWVKVIITWGHGGGEAFKVVCRMPLVYFLLLNLQHLLKPVWILQKRTQSDYSPFPLASCSILVYSQNSYAKEKVPPWFGQAVACPGNILGL